MNELSALVIHVNDKAKYVGDLLAIDRAEARKRMGLKASGLLLRR